MLRQDVRRAIESREIEALVQLCDRDWMNRLETHRDLEPACDLSCERKRRQTDGVGVRLDGDRRERRSASDSPIDQSR